MTAVLDGVEHLEDAILSVLSQDYPSLEYIIIDGGSTDGTVDIIRKYEEHIDFWSSEPDLGLYDAMNKGIARSTGELVKILNADDILTPSSVSTAVALFLEAGPEAVVASDFDVIDASGRLLRHSDRTRSKDPLGPILHPTWYVGRCIYEELGLYKTEYSIAADNEMFARMWFKGVPFVYAPTPLIQFRRGGVSTTSFRGLAENYGIMKHYFTRRVAVRMLISNGFKKFVKRVLVSLLGEVRTFALLRRAHRD